MPLQKHDQQIVFTDAYRFKKKIKKNQKISKNIKTCQKHSIL